MSIQADPPPDTGTIPDPPPDLAADTTTPPAIIQTAPPLLPSPFTYTNPPPTLVTQGAEALLYKTHFLDQSQPAALKFRPSKAYRHPTLDARLTKARVLAEARVLVKLAGLGREVRVPGVYGIEWDVSRKGKSDREVGEGEVAKGAWILMEWVEGRSVKELLRSVDAWIKSAGEALPEAEKQRIDGEVKMLLRRIGRAVGAMHSKGGVVHGDLTSSNIMVSDIGRELSGADAEQRDVNGEDDSPDLNGEITLIDFGLALQSVQDEDRAVDLYVLERAFGSTHPRQEGWFDVEVLQHPEGYRGSFKGANVVLKRLEEVRLRGRKRSMIG